MPTCSVCGKEVEPEATFCPSCGSNIQSSPPPTNPPQQVYSSPQPVPAQQMSSEEKMGLMTKRLERISYVTAGATVLLFVVVILLLFFS